MISLKVLDRVSDSLTKIEIFNQGTEDFLEQEKEGIIERYNISPEKYGNYIWILHRPVIKDDDLTTTKIRPVFNCSLEVKNAPSLNEAIYHIYPTPPLGQDMTQG